MSLTSFLKSPDVRERFRQELRMPRAVADRELLAPPLSKRYMLVGTAFDYLLRFYLQRITPDAIHGSWVAQNGLMRLDQCVTYAYDTDTEELTCEPDGGIFDKATNIFDRARIAHERYLASGRVTDQLLESTIHLAQLDGIYRAGFIDENLDENLGVAWPEDVQDLRNLISIVRRNKFLAKDICLLNPSFGNASRLVGGADADLFIDGTLIDIKTTKNFKLDRLHFNQLIGYSVLHRLSGFSGITPKPKLSRVAIYFSRHAHLEVFDLSALINPKTFPRFVKWFSERARQDKRCITRRSTERAKAARR